MWARRRRGGSCESGPFSIFDFFFFLLLLHFTVLCSGFSNRTRGTDAGARVCRKDQLKKNPVVSSDELNQVSSGLGDEAKEFSGKGGLGGMAEGIGKAFD